MRLAAPVSRGLCRRIGPPGRGRGCPLALRRRVATTQHHHHDSEDDERPEGQQREKRSLVGVQIPEMLRNEKTHRSIVDQC